MMINNITEMNCIKSDSRGNATQPENSQGRPPRAGGILAEVKRAVRENRNFLKSREDY